MSKKIVIITVIVLVIAALALAWFYRGRIFHASNQKEIRVARNLTKEQNQIYTDRIAKANDFLKTLNPKQPDYKYQLANTRLYLGEQYYGLGEISRAEEEYQAALDLNDSNVNVNAYTALALAQTDVKDYSGARQSLEKAKELAPDRPGIWLSLIALIKNQFPEERQNIPQIFEQALAATKRHVDVLASYAQFSEEQGNLEQARALWKEASDKYPQNTQYLDEYKRLGGK